VSDVFQCEGLQLENILLILLNIISKHEKLEVLSELSPKSLFTGLYEVDLAIFISWLA
jgi:hypothetical protein